MSKSCIKHVHDQTFRGHRCKRRATHGDYCHQHDPENVKRRREARMERFDAKQSKKTDDHQKLIRAMMRGAGMYGLLCEIIGSGALRDGHSELRQRISTAIRDHENDTIQGKEPS